MDYKIITSWTLDLLESKVKEMIKKGWKPIGGVSVGHNVSSGNKPITMTNYKNNVVLYQSMIKEDDKK